MGCGYGIDISRGFHYISPPKSPRMTIKRKQELIDYLLETSFHCSDTPRYALASGRKSRYYIDCRKLLSHARARALIGGLMFKRLNGLAIDGVGGMLVGAYPVAIAVSDAAAQQGKNMAVFAVRKEPKSHGLQKFIEGDIQTGQRVLVVDDVVTSGRSTVQAIKRCREEGLTVVRAMAVVERQEDRGRDRIAETGVDFDCIITLGELLNTYQKGLPA